MGKSASHKQDPVICLCNGVRRSTLIAAMDAGATTLADLFDRTYAGCGPCGGSCQPELAQLLRDYQAGLLRDRGPGHPGAR